METGSVGCPPGRKIAVGALWGSTALATNSSWRPAKARWAGAGGTWESELWPIRAISMLRRPLRTKERTPSVAGTRHQPRLPQAHKSQAMEIAAPTYQYSRSLVLSQFQGWVTITLTLR